MTSRISVLIGTQWGDEGKGKWVDVLATEHRITARYQGGNNAGHTLKVDGQQIILHLLPSGILKPNNISALLSGVVINPVGLHQEITSIASRRQLSPDVFFISERAHVVSPWHIYVDNRREEQTTKPIGTTRRGIGPTYSEKAQRSGLRFSEYIDQPLRMAWIETMVMDNPTFSSCLETCASEWEAFHKAADALQPFVCDAERLVCNHLDSGRSLLLEGAQGILLDIDHGTYPFVTSSSTLPAHACTSLGLDPRRIDTIYGIAKAYTTRVGAGPFPTELLDETGAKIAQRGAEFGATTKRPRRCGWLDGVALAHACRISGVDQLFLNKVDILTGFDQIALATAYEHPTLGTINYLPSSSRILAECRPIYTFFGGWKEVGSHISSNLAAYLQAITKITGVPIAKIGIGPGPDDFVDSLY